MRWRRRVYRSRAWRLAPVGLLLAAPASAGSIWPTLLADFSVEIEDEYVFRSSNPQAEFNDAFATVDGDIGLAFANGGGLFATLTFEPVTDPDGDWFFKGLGLYLEELYFAYPVGGGRSGDRGGVRIGKFNPIFGIAEKVAPGLYGDDLAGDYELVERIGASVEIPLDALGNADVASVAIFMADTTVLSDSLLTSRGRVSRADGGVSNTAYPGSFALSLAGEIQETGYSLGLRYQSAGKGQEADEYGGVAGLIHSFDLGRTESSLFGELAYFPQFDGDQESASFLTLGAEVGFGDFALSAVYGLRAVEDGASDHLATLSLEFDLSDDLTIGAGYRFLNEEGETGHTLGLLLTYEFGVRQLP